MLRGRAFLTGDKEMAIRSVEMDPLNKVINLDEDEHDPRLYHISVPATYLLPPIDAKRAEIDGNEQMYDYIYNRHLQDDHSRSIIAALIAYLYRGGNLLFYLPDYGDNTQNKFIFHIANIYGIHIGLLDIDPSIATTERDYFIDLNKIPLWLDMMYMETNVITWRDYLYDFPLGVQINPYCLDRLMEDINPYGTTPREQVEYIYHLVSSIKGNKNLKCPLKMKL